MAGQLISDPKERAERAAEKERFILEWLADFVYRIARKTSPFRARMNSATAKPF